MSDEINATAIVVETSRALQNIEQMVVRIARRQRDGLIMRQGDDGSVHLRCPVWRNFAEYSEVTTIYAEAPTIEEALGALVKELLVMNEHYPMRSSWESANDEGTKYP